MHKFLIKDGVGYERDFGAGSHRAAAFAKKHVGPAAVVASSGKDYFWFLPDHEDHFSDLVGPFKIVSTAATMLSYKKERDATARRTRLADALNDSTDNRRARHPKFGEGTVTGEDARSYTVVFPNQSKPLRLIKSAIEIIA